jgi:hypothetical protein
MFDPALTGSGESPIVVERSAVLVFPVTVVVAAGLVLLALLGSLVAEDTDAVLEMTVPFPVAPLTWTTMVNVLVVPAGIGAAGLVVQVTVPFVPGVGPVQLHPEGAVAETNAVVAGMGSVTVGWAASLGPLLVRVIV